MAQYVSGIHVIYGSEPSNAVTEISGGGDDINKDFGGEHVWLAADFTTDPSKACNRFVVVIQGANDSDYQDLAKGAGGDFRYLLPLANPGDDDKIVDVRLLRSSSSVGLPPSGYNGMTENINQGRGETYLYIIWKTKTIDPSPSQYVAGYSVVYGNMLSKEPRGAVTDIWNGGDNINKDFGGDYVWLVPIFVSDHKAACTGFQMVFQGERNTDLQDLAKGAGGEYRYLLQSNDLGKHAKITNIRLLRASKELDSPPSGYSGMSQNINKDRKGDYLYVIWKASEESHQHQFVADITVVYGTVPFQEPRGAVTDISGGGNDINKDFGGSYVWLVPTFTSDIKAACTGFRLAIQGDTNDAHQDLAKGAGGEHRYIFPIRDVGTAHKITGVRLLRSSSPVSSPPEGYSGMTANINQGREKDYLYLLYQSIHAPVPLFVSSVDVIYGDNPSQEPREALAEIGNNDNNINKGFDGGYIWIVPSVSADASKACTDLQILIQDSSNSRYKDLAKGAGGKYRYLVPALDPKNSVKVSDMRLLRSSTVVSSPPVGYDAISSDINKDRGGTYLYLIWRKIDCGPESRLS